eukprot:m.924418 g.924418  ORF g.924418 m.924418 type:complete len:176 (-) comp120342_c0_seq1:692-1219(-)
MEILPLNALRNFPYQPVTLIVSLFFPSGSHLIVSSFFSETHKVSVVSSEICFCFSLVAPFGSQFLHRNCSTLCLEKVGSVSQVRAKRHASDPTVRRTSELSSEASASVLERSSCSCALRCSPKQICRRHLAQEEISILSSAGRLKQRVDTVEKQGDEDSAQELGPLDVANVLAYR